MLYKFRDSEGLQTIDPVEYKDFADFGLREKDLENLVASNLLETLFEGSRLMPIYQEVQRQAVADIYALNADGDLVIFELKRSTASYDAVQQVLRYAQDAAHWSYKKLEAKFRSYADVDISLTQAHKEAFDLEEALETRQINNRQHLYVIGSAADSRLIRSVDYWKKQGLKIDFIPYRLYQIAGEVYFEIFAPPYDTHQNPADLKGVLFDTNRKDSDECLWEMMDGSYVAAYGDAKRFINRLLPGDYVFYSHKYKGIVAAGRVKRGDIKSPNQYTLCREVELLTRRPERGKPLPAMPFRKVSEVLEKNFYWASTVKTPYLTRAESELLLAELLPFLAQD